MIVTAETNPQCRPVPGWSPEMWDYRRVVDDLARRAVNAPTVRPPSFPNIQGKKTVRAYVNHSRWLWDCPECGHTYNATEQQRAYCVNCWNCGDGWWTLEYPAERAEIESALNARPVPDTRNWRWDEPVMQLLAENVAQGVMNP